MTGKIQKKIVVVTGATSGIGFASVKALVQTGAFVIGVGRSEGRNQTAQYTIMSNDPPGNAVYIKADLANQAEVGKLATEIKQVLIGNNFSHLDALVNNAGSYHERKHLTEDGIEKTFAVNHLAPFKLTYELMPYLEKADQGRVVNVSSYAHFTTPLCLSHIVNPFPYVGLLAYKRSKLGNVLFTYELNRRSDRVCAFALDPGLVDTAIASKGSKGISHWVWRNRRKKGASPDVPGRMVRDLVINPYVDISQGFYIKEGKSALPSRNARRPDLAEGLWVLSTRLTDIEWD